MVNALLVIHGTNDKVIPYAQGLKIFNQYKARKKMITIEGGEHNNLYQFDEYLEGFRSFLKEQLH